MGRLSEFIIFINLSPEDLEYKYIHTPKWDFAYIDIKDPELKRLRKKYKNGNL